MFGDFSISIKFVRRCASLALVTALVSACSSSGNKTSSEKAIQRAQTQQANTDVRSTLDTSLTYQSSQEALIDQAYTAMQQGLTPQEITPLLYSVAAEQFYSIDADLKLAQVYLYLEQNENAEIIVTRLKRGALPTKHQIPLWLVSAQLDAQKGEHLESIRTLFRLSQLYGIHLSATDKRQNNELIWQNILKLSPSSLAVFRSDFGEEVDSWIQLAELLDSFVQNPIRFSQQIQNWANNHALYSQTEFLPQQILSLTGVEAFTPNNIALILPFTGKLAKQAQAIRNGFLAGTDFDSTTNYIMLDANTLNLGQIEQAVIENNVDFIVGPLLKENISQYQTSEILTSIAQLNLNTLDLTELSVKSEQTEKQPNHFYFALSPEDEISQAVDYFVSKGVEYPAIIYADNSLGRRLYEQFNNQWLQHNDDEVESIAFQNTSKLGKAVKELLDVGLSEKRIKQIEQLFGSKIKSEERSRTDIDAIYVIANSQQTRLIKPFFDVNVSNFGNRLPIYASSRSYLIDETRSEKLDLNGLTFTETPWLLSEQSDQISQLYQQVGDNNTQLKKLFAFGYDAKNLIPVLQHLALLPEVSIKALNGALSVDSTNTVKRRLEWAQYRQGSVVVIKTFAQ